MLSDLWTEAGTETSIDVLVIKACVAVVVDTLLNNVFFDALADIVSAGALTDADVLVDVRVDIMIDALILAGEIDVALSSMGVKVWSSADLNVFASSVSSETSLISCCAPCSC